PLTVTRGTHCCALLVTAAARACAGSGRSPRHLVTAMRRSRPGRSLLAEGLWSHLRCRASRPPDLHQISTIRTNWRWYPALCADPLGEWVRHGVAEDRMPRFAPPGLGWHRDLPDGRDYDSEHDQVAPLLASLRNQGGARSRRPQAVDWREYFP